MSLIYTAIGIRGGRPSLQFQERELNLGPSTVEDAGIIPIPRPMPSIHYRSTIDWIHICGASLLQKKVYNIRSEMYNVFKLLSDHIPVTPPVITAKLSGRTEAEAEQLTNFGMTQSAQARGSMWVGSPSLQNFRDMVRVHGMIDEPTPAGNVSFVGYYAFMMAWKAVQLFTSVTESSTVYRNMIRFSSRSKIETTDVTSSTKITIGNGLSGSYDVAGFDAAAAQSVMTAPDLVPVFTPAKKFVTSNDYTWKPTDTFREGPGFAFPYFHGLILPSSETLPRLFFTYFGRSISSTQEEFSEAAPQLRRGFRSIRATKQGMELQHIFFGIDLAAKMGGTIRVIVEGRQYLGFVLLGVEGVILDKQTIKEPSPQDELNSLKLSFSRHTIALHGLKLIIDTFPLMTGEPANLDIEAVRFSSRKMAYYLHGVDLSSADTAALTSIKEALEALSYGDTYWPITQDNTMIALKAIVSGHWVHNDAPYYLGRGCGISLNKITRALAVFGPEAPTIFMGNIVRSIARPDRNDPNLAVNEKGTRTALPYIPIFKQPIITATAQWQSVQNQSQLRFFEARKGKQEFTNRTKVVTEISGGQFDSFYSLLRDYVGQKVSVESRVPNKGKKRANEIETGMSVDEGSSVRAGGPSKKARTSLADTF